MRMPARIVGGQAVVMVNLPPSVNKGDIYAIDEKPSCAWYEDQEVIIEAHPSDQFCIVQDEVADADCIDPTAFRYAKWDSKWFEDPWDQLKCLLVQWHVDEVTDEEEALEYANRFVARMRTHQLTVRNG